MNRIDKILIIRFRRVGDAVISTVLCSSLRQTFPNATIDYVLNENIAPLFENHPDIDNIITFSEDDMSTFSNYIKKVRKVMKKGNYNMIIDTRSTIKTLWFSLYSLKTPYRLGVKKTYNKFIQNYRTDNKNCIDKVDVILSLLKQVEGKFPINYNRNFKVYTTEEDKASFRNYLSTKGVTTNKPIIICAVATRLSHKMWEQQHMKKILDNILNSYEDVQLIFNYAGEKEEIIAKNLHSDMSNHPRVFSDIEAKNLKELAAMISLSTFFFGNEGGPRHISQALGIPSFAIYPPNISKQIWLPNIDERYQGIEPADISKKDSESKKLSYKQKFELITVEKVWNLLHPMLEQYIKS